MKRECIDGEWVDAARRVDRRREAEREDKATPACFKTQEFKDLAASWDKALARDGFVDIEKPEGPYTARVLAHEEQRYKHNITARTADLYTLMEQWMGQARWRTRKERQWFYGLSQGMTLAEVRREYPSVPEDCSYSSLQQRMLKEQKLMLQIWEDEDAE